MVFNQTMNQFNELPVQGQVDLSGFGSNIVSGRVDNAVVTPLVPGQPVKLASTAGGTMPVIPLTAATDATFGFINYNLKDISYGPDARIEMGIEGTVMFLTSGAAITRGAAVENVYTIPGQVVTAGGVNPAVGICLDTATGSGQLVRIYIKVPTLTSALGVASAKTAVVTATLAQINAGLVLIPGVATQKITVSNVVARVVGTFATGTSVELESTNGTPVAVITYAETAIAGSTVLVPGAANTTLGAGYGAALGTGDGMQVVNNGSAQTGGTSITFTINYTQA